jgi:hypothetical protein
MICLSAGALIVGLGSGPVTLAWMHSVERTEWREVWRETPEGLVLASARVQGSGAGMDPPEGAVLGEGGWTWTPRLPPRREIVMRRSGATADWRVCIDAVCKPMGDLVPEDADPVSLTVCP